MLFDISVGADILLVQDVILQKLHLLFQTGRKDRKTHYLDKADVLLLDVMAVLMRMVNAQRIFPGRDVVPEGQIQLKGIAHFSGNRSDGVVGLAVCLGKNKGSLIGVASPLIQDMLCQVDEPCLVLAADTDDGQRPFDDACLHILVAGVVKVCSMGAFAMAKVLFPP